MNRKELASNSLIFLIALFISALVGSVCRTMLGETAIISIISFLAGLLIISLFLNALQKSLARKNATAFDFNVWKAKAFCPTCKNTPPCIDCVFIPSDFEPSDKGSIPRKSPPPSKGDIFVAHIRGHLEAEEKVICKICGKDVDTIIKEGKTGE